jgi:hypothetical protein
MSSADEKLIALEFSPAELVSLFTALSAAGIAQPRMAREYDWYALERRLQTVLEAWRKERRIETEGECRD